MVCKTAEKMANPDPDPSQKKNQRRKENKPMNKALKVHGLKLGSLATCSAPLYSER